MAPVEKSVWNHESDKALLLTIISQGTLSPIDWATVSSIMNQKKYTFTKEGCRQHYQKIRKEFKEGTDNDDYSSVKGTPSKKTIPVVTPKPKNKKVSPLKKVTPVSNDGEDDDEDLDETPSKKRKLKKEPKPENSPVKFEPQFGPIDLENDDLYE